MIRVKSYREKDVEGLKSAPPGMNPRSGSGYAKTTRLGWCGKWEGEA